MTAVLKSPISQKGILQFLKFCTVGILNTLITLATIDLLGHKIGIPYDAANLIGFLLGFINSFILNKIWTFKSRNHFFREGLLFIAAFGIAYGCQWVILRLVLLFLSGSFYIPLSKSLTFTIKHAQIISLAFYTLINFLLNKFISFRKTENREDEK